MVWSYPTSYIYATPALSADGAVVYICGGYHVYGLAADTGAFVWQFLQGGPFLLDPVVTPFGSVILAGGDGNLYALNGTQGTLLQCGYSRRAAPSSRCPSSPPLVPCMLYQRMVLCVP